MTFPLPGARTAIPAPLAGSGPDGFDADTISFSYQISPGIAKPSRRFFYPISTLAAFYGLFLALGLTVDQRFAKLKNR